MNFSKVHPNGDNLQEFFYREMNDQSHYEGDVIDWDDCSQGAVEFDAYDP